MNRAWWGGLAALIGVLPMGQTTALLWVWAPWWRAADPTRMTRRARVGRMLGITGLVLIGLSPWLGLFLTAALLEPMLSVGVPLALITAMLQSVPALHMALSLPGSALLAVGGIVQALVPRPGPGRWLVLAACALTVASAIVMSAIPEWPAGIAWALVGGALMRSSGGPWRRASDGTPLTNWSALASALASRLTVISGAAMVLVLAVALGWQAGLALTLLLYAHELGHVLFAFARGVQVTRAPTFLPGIGAFVTTAPRTNAWDELWVSIGGPIFGGTLALVCKLVSVYAGLPWLHAAADFALLLNLLNMAPLPPFDGGKIVALSGRIGAVIGLVLGALFLVEWLTVLLGVFIVLGGWLTISSFRKPEPTASWPTRLAALGVYLGVFGLLSLAQFAFGSASGFEFPRPELASLVNPTLIVLFAYGILSLLLLQRVRHTRAPAVRYAVLLLFGWWWYGYRAPRVLPVLAQVLLETIRPTPDAERLGRLAQRFAERDDPMAGNTLALAYDVLVTRIGPAHAQAWLMRQVAVCSELDAQARLGLVGTLENFGHAELAHTWAAYFDAGERDASVPVLEVEPA